MRTKKSYRTTNNDNYYRKQKSINKTHEDYSLVKEIYDESFISDFARVIFSPVN